MTDLLLAPPPPPPPAPALPPPPPARVRVRIRDRAPNLLPPPRRRDWRRVLWALAAAVGIVLLLVADAAWVGVSLRRDVSVIRAQLEQGGTALREGRTFEAAVAFETASRRSLGMQSSLRHPAPWLAGVLPFVGRNVDAVRAVAEASERLAYAGTALTTGAERAGWDGTIRTKEGRVNLRLIRDTLGPLDDAQGHVDAAAAFLRPVDPGALVDVVAEPFRSARAELEDAVELVQNARELAGLLPGFLGRDEPRRYLLAMLNPSDPRGSGGYVGIVALLEADSGTLTLSDVRSTNDIGDVSPVEAPAEALVRYERFGSTRVLHATTYAPHFPTSAAFIQDVWAATGGEPTDGVIALDPVALSYLLEVTGPVQVDAWPEPVGATNAVEVLAHDTFLLPSDRGNRVQEALVGQIWQAGLDGLASEDVLAALGRAARERHLQVFANEASEQGHLEALDAAGLLEVPRHPLLVASFGGSANRAGYFAERSIDHTVTLRVDGSAAVRMTMVLTNGAPAGPPSPLLGSGGPGEVVGGYSEYESVYLPAGATDVRAQVDGGLPLFQVREPELGGEVLMVLVPTLPGGSATLEVTYTIPAALREVEGGRRFELSILPLPALRPTSTTLRIVPAEDDRVLEHASGMRIADGAATWSGDPVEPVVLWVDVG